MLDDEYCDVVCGCLVAYESVEERVDERVRREECWQACEMQGYLFDAGVKGTVAAFDKAVGIDDERRAA